MSTPVLVVDPLECFRDGLSAALRRCGFDPVCPCDGEDWELAEDDQPVIVALLDDADGKRLCAMRERNSVRPAVALLPELSTSTYRWAVRCGASATQRRDASAQDIVETLRAACAGRSILPLSVAIELARCDSHDDNHPRLDVDEIRWLTALGKGAKVHELAFSEGYSEREMFRRLHRLYDHMGVSSKTAALLAAQRWGLV